jgi:hypothetical protein
MSRDQKPGKAKIVVNAPPQSLAAITSPERTAATPADHSAVARTAKAPVALLAGIFLVACAAAGAGVALLPWISR